MTGKNLIFLLGFLNSKVASFYFKSIGCNLGGGYRWYNYTIEKILVVNPKLYKSKGKIEKLTNQLCKKDVNQNLALMLKMDNLFYNEYCLNSDEINFLKRIE